MKMSKLVFAAALLSATVPLPFLGCVLMCQKPLRCWPPTYWPRLTRDDRSRARQHLVASEMAP
jgi:hypothetical protein